MFSVLNFTSIIAMFLKIMMFSYSNSLAINNEVQTWYTLGLSKKENRIEGHFFIYYTAILLSRILQFKILEINW